MGGMTVHEVRPGIEVASGNKARGAVEGKGVIEAKGPAEAVLQVRIHMTRQAKPGSCPAHAIDHPLH